MSTSSISNLITVATFSGQSKFAADFQQVLSRAVDLQSLNLQNMQLQQQDEANRQSALQSLDQQVSALQNTLTSLISSTGLASMAGTVSDPNVASMSLSDGATPATYTLEVQSVGSHSRSYSSDGFQTVTDPSSQNISSSNSFTLTVGGVAHTVTGDSLQALAKSINGDPSLGVTASIVNAGTSSSPDYRIALQATALGNVSIQLNDGTNDLMTTLSTGSPAVYYVDGLPNAITSDSDTVTLAPGVTVNLQSTNSGSPATITVSQNTSAVETALQSFANAYNAVVDQLNAAHGTNASGLQGDSILSSAQSALRSILGYSGNNGSSLSSLGLDLDTSGHLTFNETEFSETASQGFSVVSQYLGDSSSGFIYTVTNALDSLEDPISGAIKVEEQQISDTLSSLNDKINNEVDRINTFQQNLLEQLSEADANIYGLENQNTLYEGLFNTNNDNSNN